jgi:hypothetical protein
MTVDDASGTMTICRRGRMGLYADDHGVTVRNAASRARRFAWAEVSHFADGSILNEGDYSWILHIVLRTGRKVRVHCTFGSPTPETLIAIRQVATRYGVPADLAGVPMTKGRPAQRALYHDPGGQAGLRYWDSRQWSPLLPLDVSKWSSRTVRKGSGSWPALPTAEGHWTYAATQATRWTVWFATFAALSAGLLAGGLVTELWWDRGAHHRHMTGWGFWILGGLAALYGFVAWRNRRLFLKLDDAANGLRAISVHRPG